MTISTNGIKKNQMPSKPKENCEELESARKTSLFEARCIRRGFPLLHLKKLPRDGPDGPWRVSQAQITDSLAGGGIFILFGVRGTGKTQMAVDIGGELLSSKQTLCEPETTWPMYSVASDIFRDIRGAFRKESLVSEMEIIAKYLKPKLLIIDEAHERGETDFEDRTLTHIVDKRYSSMLSTVIISNLQRNELAKSLGNSIVSRSHEGGFTIECNWPSFREKKS